MYDREMNTLIKTAAIGACRVAFPLTERLFDCVLGSKAAQNPLQRPIIVIGPERSGTTLVYALLSNDPGVYALSNLAEWFPDHPFSSSLLQRLLSSSQADPFNIAIPDTTGTIKGTLFVPREGARYLVRHLGSRSGGWKAAPHDYFSATDLDDLTRETLPLDLKKRIYAMGKKRLLLKQPGFSLKIGYLNALFPDAIFVHCVRNPFSNFASLVDQKTRYNNPDWGLRVPDWSTWSDLPVELRAARQLSGTYDLIQQSIREIENGKDRYIPVRYEDLHSSFAEETKRLFNRCGLEAPATVLKNSQLFVLPSERRRCGSEKVYDPEVRKLLEALCERMGYDASAEADSWVAHRAPQTAPVQSDDVYQGAFGLFSATTQTARQSVARFVPQSWRSNFHAAAKWFFARKGKTSADRPSFREQWAQNWVTILASWALLGGVMAMTHFSNPHMIFTPFYLVPCGILALTLNYRWGIVIAGVAAVGGPVVQSFVGEAFSDFALILWNSFMRFILYAAFVMLLDRVRVEAVSAQTSNA
jgi:hypothetical protein